MDTEVVQEAAKEGSFCTYLREFAADLAQVAAKGREFFAAFCTFLRHFAALFAYLRVFGKIFFIWVPGTTTGKGVNDEYQIINPFSPDLTCVGWHGLKSPREKKSKMTIV